MATFIGELEMLINRFSKENDSNTPDFILAQYLTSCLAAFSVATSQRDRWYDFKSGLADLTSEPLKP